MSQYCGKCGTALPNDAGFCPSCGTSVATDRPSPQFASQQFAQPAYAPPAYPQSTYAPAYGGAAAPLSPFAAMVLPLKRYADFSGRSTRMEYWMFTLLWWVVIIAAFILFGVGSEQAQAAGHRDDPFANSLAVTGFAIMTLWWLGTIIPCIAVIVRRLHDQDKSGALVILIILLNLFLSFIGWIVQTIFMCIDGTPGTNQYGPDPKGADVSQTFS